MWEAFQHAGWEGLDNLTAIIDVNRLGQTRETMLGWDLDGYVRRFEAFGWHAIEIDGHDVDAIEAAYDEAEAHRRPADRDHRPHEEGQGRQGGRGPARQARQAARRPRRGDRRARRRARPDGASSPRRGRRAARLRGARRRAPDARSSATRSRPARPTARRWPRSARSAATSSRSTARSPTPRTRRTSATRTRTATSRCSSPSSRSSRRRSASRSAAGCRSRRRSRRSSAARYDFVRMAAISRANMPLVGLARRRVDRRGRPVADGARGHRLVPRDPRLDRAAPVRRQPGGRSWWREMADTDGIVVHAHAARQDAGAHARRTRTSGSAAAASPHDGDDVAIIACGITVDEAVGRPRRSPATGIGARVIDCYSVKPIDADAVRAAARDCGAIDHRRGPLARGRARRRRARGAGRSRRPRRRSPSSRCARCRARARPTSCCTGPGSTRRRSPPPRAGNTRLGGEVPLRVSPGGRNPRRGTIRARSAAPCGAGSAAAAPWRRPRLAAERLRGRERDVLLALRPARRERERVQVVLDRRIDAVGAAAPVRRVAVAVHREQPCVAEVTRESQRSAVRRRRVVAVGDDERRRRRARDPERAVERVAVVDRPQPVVELDVAVVVSRSARAGPTSRSPARR